MEKITDVREGVIKLLTIREHDIPEFSIEPRKEGEFVDTFVWDGKKIPVFNMLYDPRIYQMQNWGKRGDNSALNVYSYYASDEKASAFTAQKRQTRKHGGGQKAQAAKSGRSALTFMFRNVGKNVLPRFHFTKNRDQNQTK